MEVLIAVLQADAALEMERTAFYQQSMNHVLLLQQVQEKKKFEFVEVVRIWSYDLRFEIVDRCWHCLRVKFRVKNFDAWINGNFSFREGGVSSHVFVLFGAVPDVSARFCCVLVDTCLVQISVCVKGEGKLTNKTDISLNEKFWFRDFENFFEKNLKILTRFLSRLTDKYIALFFIYSTFIPSTICIISNYKYVRWDFVCSSIAVANIRLQLVGLLSSRYVIY